MVGATENVSSDNGLSLQLTERAKVQMKVRNISENSLKNVLSCTNGYAGLWFEENDNLYLKKLKSDLYEVWSLRKDDGVITDISKNDLTVGGIVEMYSRCDLFYSQTHYAGAKHVFRKAIKNGNHPLILYAKQSGDKYFECELKFLAGIASDDEIEYLEKVVKRNRFISKKETYGADDVEIKSYEELRRRHMYDRQRWLCKIVIDGAERCCIWQNDDLSFEIQMDYGYVGFGLDNKCAMSYELRDKFSEKVCAKI